METMKETLLQMALGDWVRAAVTLIAVLAVIHVIPWAGSLPLLEGDDKRRRSLTSWLLDRTMWPPWLKRPDRSRHDLPLEVISGEGENTEHGLTRRQWRAMIERPGGGHWIGIAEVTFFYAALIAGAPEAIAMWLAFKVAAKWESWKNVIQWPERLPGEPEQPSGKSAAGYDAALAASYVGARNLIGGWLHGRFVLGTILNIIWAFAGYALYLKGPDIFGWVARSACALVGSRGP